jgi:hypothetical protein
VMTACVVCAAELDSSSRLPGIYLAAIVTGACL